MSRNKGFTLVEILAMLVVLAIIIGISIPNINAILRRQRINKLIADATSMVETAKVKSSKNNDKPINSECYIYSLDYLNVNDSINKGPNDGEYDQYNSFVIKKRRNNTYIYYVRLVEKLENNTMKGIELTESTQVKDLTADATITTNIGIVKAEPESTSKTKLNGIGECTTANIKKYYTTKIYCANYDNKWYDNEGNVVNSCEAARKVCPIITCE